MRCLHCAGTGREPFSDETCSLCLGEQELPAEINREYYDQIMTVLDDSDNTSGTDH